ncbi:hypothetical protein [Nocardioides sp. zg-DK7169]|uniref:hypothetical protein n=1 Tax=Nocardioides sp. zg-DK7169 TaxID=2736600 RepID=UPI00155523FE|nr:hypothetical protein [Nocardioides sp. zg-DK7169]NPC98715.1 hypothetical protein [Nocardioides sp. zg-DK7169]
MARLREVLPRPVLVLLALVVVVQAVLLAHLLAGRAEPRDVPLAVVAPPILAQELAARAADLEGRPFEPVPTDERAAAVAAVAEGRVDAAVLVDLTRDADTLVVRTTLDPELVAAVRARVASLGSSYDRGLRVREVAPPDNPDADRSALLLLPAGWVVLGLLVAAGIAHRRGSLARTGRLAALRVGATLVGALGLGAVLAALTTTAWSGAFVVTWLAGSAVLLASGWLVLALCALYGLPGIAVAVALFVLLATPALTMRDLALLPQPWPVVVPLTPYGAGAELLGEAVQTGTTSRAPWLVLGTWLAVPLLTVALVRRERPAAQRWSGTMSASGS